MNTWYDVAMQKKTYPYTWANTTHTPGRNSLDAVRNELVLRADS